MNAEEILKVIRTLAMSQGFYGRLLRDIQQDSSILDELVKMNFNNSLDMVLWLEG